MSGLALLGGGTSIAAVAGGAHSVFATVLLGLLAIGMGHSLLVEIRRQAHRQSRRWARTDTINAVLLGCWAEAALVLTVLEAGPVPVRAVGGVLAAAYAGSCVYFVTQRRRTIAAQLRIAGVASLPVPAEPAVPRPTEPAIPCPAEPAIPCPAEPAIPCPAEPAIPCPAEAAIPCPAEAAIALPAEREHTSEPQTTVSARRAA